VHFDEQVYITVHVKYTDEDATNELLVYPFDVESLQVGPMIGKISLWLSFPSCKIFKQFGQYLYCFNREQTLVRFDLLTGDTKMIGTHEGFYNLFWSRDNLPDHPNDAYASSQNTSDLET